MGTKTVVIGSKEWNRIWSAFHFKRFNRFWKAFEITNDPVHEQLAMYSYLLHLAYKDNRG